MPGLMQRLHFRLLKCYGLLYSASQYGCLPPIWRTPRFLRSNKESLESSVESASRRQLIPATVSGKRGTLRRRLFICCALCRRLGSSSPPASTSCPRSSCRSLRSFRSGLHQSALSACTLTVFCLSVDSLNCTAACPIRAQTPLAAQWLMRSESQD